MRDADSVADRYEELVRRFGPDLSRKEIWWLSLAALGVLVLLVAGLSIAAVKGTFLFFMFCIFN